MPDQASQEDRPRGEAELFTQPILHFPWPVRQLVLTQLISTLALKAICTAAYLKGFRGYSAGCRNLGLGGRGGLFGFCGTLGGLCSPSLLLAFWDNLL